MWLAYCQHSWMGLWTRNITMFVTKTWHNSAKFAPWYQTPMLIFNSPLSQHWHTCKATLRNFKKIYKEEKTTLIPNMACLPGLLTQWQNALHRSLLSHRLCLAMQKHTTPAEGYQTFMVLKYMFHQRRRQRLSLSSSLSNSAAAPCEQQHINSSTVYRHWQKNYTAVSLQISITECSISAKTSSLTCAPNKVMAYIV